MDSGGQKPEKGKAVVGVTDKGSGKKGDGCPDLGPYILGGGTVGIVVRLGDVVDDPTHWEGVGRIPTQGGPQADREVTSAREIWCVDISPAGVCDGGGGAAGGG